MFVTKYDQHSGTAYTMEFSSYMHWLLLAAAVVSAPILGPVSYLISLCVDPDIQGAVFLASWAALLFLSLITASAYWLLRDIQDTRKYYRDNF